MVMGSKFGNLKKKIKKKTEETQKKERKLSNKPHDHLLKYLF